LNTEYPNLGVETPGWSPPRPEALKQERRNTMESTLQKPALIAGEITPKAKTIVYWWSRRIVSTSY
jgi:hypothetical protein